MKTIKCPNCSKDFSAGFVLGRYFGIAEDYWFCSHCQACLRFNMNRRLHTLAYFFLSVTGVLVSSTFLNLLSLVILSVILSAGFLFVLNREQIQILRGGYIVKRITGEKKEFIPFTDWEQVQDKSNFVVISEQV